MCELLTPYLESPTGIFSHASVDGFPAQKIVEREFSHVLSRQGSREADPSLPELLRNYLVRLSEGQGGTQKARGRVESVIGLCRSVAFVQRNPGHP